MNWLSGLILRWRDRHDPALSRYTFGVKPSPWKTYDQSKASAMYRRSLGQTESGRALKKPRPRKPAEIVPLRRAW